MLKAELPNLLQPPERWAQNRQSRLTGAGLGGSTKIYPPIVSLLRNSQDSEGPKAQALLRGVEKTSSKTTSSRFGASPAGGRTAVAGDRDPPGGTRTPLPWCGEPRAGAAAKNGIWGAWSCWSGPGKPPWQPPGGAEASRSPAPSSHQQPNPARPPPPPPPPKRPERAKPDAPKGLPEARGASSILKRRERDAAVRFNSAAAAAPALEGLTPPHREDIAASAVAPSHHHII